MPRERQPDNANRDYDPHAAYRPDPPMTQAQQIERNLAFYLGRCVSVELGYIKDDANCTEYVGQTNASVLATLFCARRLRCFPEALENAVASVHQSMTRVAPDALSAAIKAVGKRAMAAAPALCILDEEALLDEQIDDLMEAGPRPLPPMDAEGLRHGFAPRVIMDVRHGGLSFTIKQEFAMGVTRDDFLGWCEVLK